MKATHNGTCQICGSLQAVAVKGSVLALHGYTTRWGFFSGTCTGSKEPPFELSKGLIDGIIVTQQARVVTLTAQAEALRASNEGTETWVNVYTPARRIGRNTLPSSHVWQLKPVTLADTGRAFWSFPVTTDKGTTQQELPGYYGHTLAEVVAKQNAKYADALDHQVAQVKQYIKWQQGRIAGWVPTDLKPRVDEAKKATTRTAGARVEQRVAGVWEQGTVLHSYPSFHVFVRVKFDNGTTRDVRQSWLRLAAESVQSISS